MMSLQLTLHLQTGQSHIASAGVGLMERNRGLNSCSGFIIDKLPRCVVSI